MPRHLRGAGLVETVVVMPLLLFLTLAIWQAALGHHAKSSVNYATFEAARAGAVAHARIDGITQAFIRGMTPYYGGGRTPAELADSVAKARADIAVAMRVEILSPSRESFFDYGSPSLQAVYATSETVIPHVGIDELSCPRDVPRCNSDPRRNVSGQTLRDANLLKLRITYGIPTSKQMPVVGRFYTWALDRLGAGAGDPFKQSLISQGRIPIVAQAVVRMQSDAIRNPAVVNKPGRGNDGRPVDPGPPAPAPELPPYP